MIRLKFNAVAGAVLLATATGAAVLSLVWTPQNPMALNLAHRLAAPSSLAIFGRDEFGRDVVSRLMAGAAQSLSVGLATVLLAVVVGGGLGLVSGYLRGTTDRLLMTVSDAVLAFPGTLLALGLLVILGPNRIGIILALAIAYTPSVLRIVRSSVLSLREREFIEASAVIGNSAWTTMFRHIMPNCLAPVAVLATSMFGWVILAESGLSFLGLGVPPPTPTWGNMLSSARPYLESAPWLGIAPGVCISLTLLGINLFGDALRDHFDPRMRGG